tara:strand:- start:8973 stop:9296 length:324 start_codon:yes stop_codon:yes gene_type:complete
MIDIDKYEGHTLEYGMHCARLLEHLDTEPNRRLIADALPLLEEVKRLHLLSVHYREVISRAITTLLSNPPEEMFESSSPTLTQDIGDIVGFYTQAMGHAIGILEGTE